jgi:hypothetical protein
MRPALVGVEKALCCVPPGRSLAGGTSLGPLPQTLDAPWKDASHWHADFFNNVFFGAHLLDSKQELELSR